MIMLKGIEKTYCGKEIKTKVLKGVDLSISKGEFVCIFGESGSGKSTLLNILGLLDDATIGTYGANMAVMMNIPENYDKVVEEIKAYAKDHSQVNYFDVDNGNLIYEKKELLLERSKTKLLYVASAAGNIIIMLLCGIFVLSIKMECDFPETEWKYRFYIQSGMSSAKVRKGIIKECLLSGGLPVICGTIISILYCSMLLYAKHLQIEWVHRYFKGIILIVGAIWLLFAVFSLIFAYRNIRKIEGDSRDGKK